MPTFAPISPRLFKSFTTSDSQILWKNDTSVSKTSVKSRTDFFIIRSLHNKMCSNIRLIKFLSRDL